MYWFIMAILIFIILVVSNFAALFQSAKKNIITAGENEVEQSALEVNNFLVQSVDAVDGQSNAVGSKECGIAGCESSSAAENYRGQGF